MKYRLFFYGWLFLIICLSLVYLSFFIVFSWYESTDQSFSELLNGIIYQNSRWITWGICAGGLGLITGIFSAIGLFFSKSEEGFFLEFYEEIILDLVYDKFIPNINVISLFLLFAIIAFLLVSENWYIGLKRGLELIGIIAWVILIVSSLIVVLTLLSDLLRNTPNFIRNMLFRDPERD